MKMNKTVLIIIGIILLLVVFRITTKVLSSQKKIEQRIIPISSMQTTIGTISDKITVAGDIQAFTEVQVRPRAAARVAEIYVEEGTYVKKGDKLLTFLKDIAPDSDIYEDMIVRSPIDGVVGKKLVKEGEQVTSTMGMIDPVFVIYNIDTMKIFSEIPEKNYSSLKKGLNCEITIDALPGKKFSGFVYNIRPVIDPMTRTTQVEIRIPNPSHKIVPGMFSKVDVVFNRKDNVMIVPFDAVIGDKDFYVFVNDNGIARKKPVTVGVLEENNIEIKSGLTKTDKVIVVGQRVLRDGTNIEESTK